MVFRFAIANFKIDIQTASSQILPYFVIDKLGHLTGVPGIFVACLFSGALR